MRDEHPVAGVELPPPTPPRRARRLRWLLWVALVVAAAVALRLTVLRPAAVPVTVYQFSPLEYQLGKTRAEIPAGNGHGNARAIARVYGALARGGEIDGYQVLSSEAIERAIPSETLHLSMISARGAMPRN